MGPETIDSESRFEEVTAAPAALLFAHAAWSGPSVVSLGVFNKWLREETAALPPAYILDIDSPWWETWSRKRDLVDHGWGGVYWLKGGTVAGSVPNASSAGKDALSARSREFKSRA